MQGLSYRIRGARSNGGTTVEEGGDPDDPRDARPARPLVQALDLDDAARKEHETRPSERDGVERGLVQIAKLEIREAEEVADARCRENQPADLSRSQGDPVARKDPGAETGPAALVDPAVERRDEVLSAVWAVGRREDEPRPRAARRRRQLVRGLHDVPEVVLV